MIDIRSFDTLAHRDHGWLDTRYHFSFADYHNPDRMGWGAIRVWNDDRIGARSGFPPHPHRDMEIITFVRSGAITHQDSMGNQGRTAAGNVQVMSAGTGVTHAEFNLEDEATTLFQIWIVPDRTGGEPDWGMRAFPRGDRAGQWVTLASGESGQRDVLPLRADAHVMAATLARGDSIVHSADPVRHLYMVPVGGAIRVNGAAAGDRSGIAITGESEIFVEAINDLEIVLVDAR